ncbi:helix-turn-helix domain-containing protein [Brevibacillus centrosporus]|uniref:helix-turn-helix domain-containing protein n=1 Tax=Brevibacillus centrosporus TaxID=54910 RepID=UPI003D1EE213
MNDDKLKEKNKSDVDQLNDEIDALAKNLGVLIRYFRELRGLSLNDVYMVSGISPSYLNRLEQGQRDSPSIKIVKRFAEALKIPSDVLFEAIFHEKAPKERNLSLEELLICSDYLVNDEPVNREIKEQLLAIVKHILSCEWTSETKMRESCNLADMIDRLRKVS